jgi:hypothetical protein
MNEEQYRKYIKGLWDILYPPIGNYDSIRETIEKLEVLIRIYYKKKESDEIEC